MADKQLMKNLRLWSGHVITLAREDECTCHKEKGKNISTHFMNHIKYVYNQRFWVGGHSSCFYLFSLQRRERRGLYLGHSTCSSTPLVGWNTWEKIKSGYVPEAEHIAGFSGVGCPYLTEDTHCPFHFLLQEYLPFVFEILWIRHLMQIISLQNPVAWKS